MIAMTDGLVPYRDVVPYDTSAFLDALQRRPRGRLELPITVRWGRDTCSIWTIWASSAPRPGQAEGREARACA